MHFHLLNTLPIFLLSLSGLIVYIKPESLGFIFLLNLWGLSYPHTLSTFSKKEFKTNKYKLFGFIAFTAFLIGTSAVAYFYDLVMIMNGYFVMQLFHYIRQNYGISKKFRAQYDAMDLQINGLLFFVFLLTSQNLTFFQFKIWTYPIDFNFAYFYFIHLSFVVYKRLLLVKTDLKNILSFEHIQYTLFSLFVLEVLNFEFVWIGMNMIHNLQYLFVVNIKDHQKKFFHFYIPIFLCAFVLMKTMDYVNEYFHYSISISFIVVISLNLCHYLFDSFLWRGNR